MSRRRSRAAVEPRVYWMVIWSFGHRPKGMSRPLEAAPSGSTHAFDPLLPAGDSRDQQERETHEEQHRAQLHRPRMLSLSQTGAVLGLLRRISHDRVEWVRGRD